MARGTTPVGRLGLLLAAIPAGACEVESCFVAGTLIATPCGPRPIESLVVGDLVWSFDAQVGLVMRSLQAIHRSVARIVCRVEAGDALIRGVTPAHPMYDATLGAYVALRDLSPQARLLLVRSEGTQAVSIDRWRIEEAPEPVFEVFNLSVQGPEHNYIADGVLVHNKGPEPPDDISLAVCGDLIVEQWEECDDGNQVDADDCSNDCEKYTTAPRRDSCAGAFDVQVPEHCVTRVSFEDPVLESLVRSAVAQPSGDLVHENVAGLRQLSNLNEPITDLGGIECLTGLRVLNLSHGSIADLEPLSQLTSLVHLILENQSIEDISPLSELCALETLRLAGNSITYVAPLGFTGLLSRLDLQNNTITEPMALTSSSLLVDLNLSGNPLSTLQPLAGAVALEYLFLDDVGQVDLTGLAQLRGLHGLSAQRNGLTDLSFLDAWDPDAWNGLVWFKLQDNRVEDLTPLVELPRLGADRLDVHLEGNPIDCDAEAVGPASWRDGLGIYTDCVP